MKFHLRALALAASLLPAALLAEVTPVAHYNLHGLAGVRDTAAPETLADRTGKSPALRRSGTPKITTESTPAARRREYDSVVKFESPDQAYATDTALVQGDNFVVEVWALAHRADDPGRHTVLANGDRESGFALAQRGEYWVLFVAGAGTRNLAPVKPGVWTHLAVVKSDGGVSAWIDGRRVAERLPSVGGGAARFALGASEPGKEGFHGWIAEARYATFKPGRFDPAEDFLLDTGKLKTLRAADIAGRERTVAALLATPGATPVTAFDEKPAQADWLLSPPTTPASVQVKAGEKNLSAQIQLSNGLVSRTFLVTDNLGCVSFKRSDKAIEFVRSVKPEARVRVDGAWVEIGGLAGMPDNGFLVASWYGSLTSRPGALRFTGMTVDACKKPYEWRPKCNAPADIAWPAKGRRVTFRFAADAGAEAPAKDLVAEVTYEIYDGLPVVMKTLAVKNGARREILVEEFEGEHLAVQPSNSRMMHIESDYSFGAANGTNLSSGLGIHSDGGRPEFAAYRQGGGTTRFLRDPDWGSMATLNPAEDLFLQNPENALLLSRPPTGPHATLRPGETFEAFRTFEILNDTTEKERFHLAQRRFYRKLAPQTNEKMFEVHAPLTRDLRVLAPLMDQMAELGFEQLQAPEHPGSFDYADNSPENIASMKPVCDYAKTKGIRVGAYQLAIASVGYGKEVDCVAPETGEPGSVYGRSVCVASRWGDRYFENMWEVIEKTGLGAYKPDGPYHGDPCASTTHAHHKGLADSQWAQWKWMCKVLAEGQRRDLYLTIPDYYFLNGQVCTGMGYREATDLLDIVLQTVLYRQYIFDATFHKTAPMGWVNLNTEVLPGGMEANVDRYERAFFTMLSSGAQVWVRGHRLYDGPKSRAMLTRWMAWYRRHREVILGDIIHLRRPDGRDLDYTLHVNPQGKEKGLLLVFNPTDEPLTRTLDLPLYYTGLSGAARLREQDGPAQTVKLDGAAAARLTVTIPAHGHSWYLVESAE